MRDDLKKLPLPPEAKAYARRKGMKALRRQPQQFIGMVAAVSNQKHLKHGFKNTNAVGRVPHAVKECARMIVAYLVEIETETDEADYQEFNVYADTLKDVDGKITFNVEVPTELGTIVNKIWVRDPLDQNGVLEIEQRMRHLARTRKYPEGSFFVAPWGTYLIHGGTIGKL
jgi:hypothetical protein